MKDKLQEKSSRTDFSDWSIFTKWSIRKISFIAILISISVVFTIIGVQILPIISIPTFKISFIGLPIKISGYIFGPIIGFIVGLFSDLISFMIIPSIYHPIYTLATILDGVIAGIVGWLFIKLLNYYFSSEFRQAQYEIVIVKTKHQINDLIIENETLTIKQQNLLSKLKKRIIYYGELKKEVEIKGTKTLLMNINMFSALIILAIVLLFIVWVVKYKIDDETLKKGIIKNRIAFLFMLISGYLLMFIFLIIARFKMRPNRYMIIVPIIIFSALIELVNVPLLSWADVKSFQKNGEDQIFVFMFQHIIFTPIKIWFNSFVIFFTYNIISSLVYKNDDIYY